MYQSIRIKCAEYASERMKQNVGDKNSQFGTVWIYNVNLKQNKKLLKTDSIPDGWIKGRKIKEKNCLERKKDIRRTIIEKKQEDVNKEVIELFEEYEDSQITSLTQFFKSKNLKCTGPGMLMRFARIVPNYKLRLKQKNAQVA